jgi:hypothetical protein
MAEVESLPRQDLLRWIKEGKVAGKDYVLVDVRRVDLEVRALTIYYLTPEVFDEYFKSAMEARANIYF